MYLAIAMYHNSPPVHHLSECGKHSNIWMRDSFMRSTLEDAFETAFPDKTGDEIQEGLQRVLAVEAQSWDIPPDVGDPIEYDVYVLGGTNEHLLQLAHHWADAINEDFDGIGGDDTVYDYFPDYVDGFRQLCQAIGAEELYKATTEKIAQWYRDEVGADLIPDYKTTPA